MTEDNLTGYFLIQNLGYDGLIICRHNDLTSAETDFKDKLKEQGDWDEKFPDSLSDKGLVVVQGKVVISDHIENVLDRRVV